MRLQAAATCARVGEEVVPEEDVVMGIVEEGKWKERRRREERRVVEEEEVGLGSRREGKGAILGSASRLSPAITAQALGLIAWLAWHELRETLVCDP